MQKVPVYPVVLPVTKGTVHQEGGFGPVDMVMVSSGNGIISGMRGGVDLPDTLNGDFPGEDGIPMILQAGRQFCFMVKMGKILYCVDPAVGPPAAGDLQCRDPQENLQCIFHDFLDGGLACLFLPAVKGSAVEGTFDEKSHAQK